MARISVKDREVYCIELERFDTIGNFAAELGLGKVYYISGVVDKPNRTAGGCHFVSLDYAAEHPVEEVTGPHHRSGYAVQCIEDGAEWDSIMACAKARGLDY